MIISSFLIFPNPNYHYYSFIIHFIVSIHYFKLFFKN